MLLKKSALALAISTTLTSSFISFYSFADEDTQAATAKSSNDIEVITVEGEFRKTNIQKVASSLTLLTETDIAQRNAQHIEELIAVSPNVNFASGSQRARYFQIRGIGERSQFVEPINPSVGVVIDDVDFTGVGSVASMFDVAQTEIFRGPQGTRFGANAMAGLINITTNAPTDDFEGAIKLTAGNYNSKGAGVVLSGPANDIANYRLAVEQYKSDGFIENVYLDRDDTNNRDELSVRGKLAIKASKDLTIDLNLLHFNFNNGYDAFSLDNNRKTYSDQPGFDKQKTSAISAKFTYEGLAQATLVSILSYADSDLAYGYDEDWAYGEYEYNPDDWDNDIYNPDPCITPTGCLADFDGYSSTDHYFRDKKTKTAEFRLVSKPGHEIFNNSTAWVVGAYFKQDEELLTRQYTYLESNYLSSFDAENIALFGQLDSQLTENLLLTTGLRVERRSADFNDSENITFDPSETMVGGKVVLSYTLSDSSLVYGSANRGYKAGGFNTDGSLDPEYREFSTETLWNYELGYKTRFFDNSAYLRAALFYMDRDNIQLNTYQLVGVSFVTYRDNAATANNYGLELESAWQINDTVELYGALGLLETEFNNYINGDGEDLSGREQAHAPNYQFNLGMNLYIGDAWLFNLSVDGKDEFYFSDTHSEKSTAVELLNASLTYSKNDYQIKLWARNLTDKDYANRGFYFGNDPRDFYAEKVYLQHSEPRVVGVTFDYKF